MAEQKNSISLELAINAHKFTCPYYSPNSAGLDPPPHCGAYNIYQQRDCSGNCWYMKHFKELLNDLTNESK